MRVVALRLLKAKRYNMLTITSTLCTSIHITTGVVRKTVDYIVTELTWYFRKGEVNVIFKRIVLQRSESEHLLLCSAVNQQFPNKSDRSTIIIIVTCQRHCYWQLLRPECSRTSTASRAAAAAATTRTITIRLTEMQQQCDDGFSVRWRCVWSPLFDQIAYWLVSLSVIYRPTI